MKTEFEAKILEVDPLAVSQAILAAGGRQVASGMQRRYVYPLEDGKWLGLRDSGSQTSSRYQENHRDSFLLTGARVEIDTWPMLVPCAEIEADDTGTVTKPDLRDNGPLAWAPGDDQPATAVLP